MNGCLVFIMCHSFLLFSRQEQFSLRWGYSEGKRRVNCVAGLRLTHPPTPETSKHGHVGTSSAFCHCSASSRSSNYSLQKISTLLPPRPRYNNTTKLFKETSCITRGKYKAWTLKASELWNIEPTLHGFYDWQIAVALSICIDGGEWWLTLFYAKII